MSPHGTFLIQITLCFFKKKRWKIKLLSRIEGEIPGGAGDGRIAEYDQNKSSPYTKFSKSNMKIIKQQIN